MNWQTNRAVIILRSVARKSGLTKVFGRLMSGDVYEQAFDNALFEILREGDVVWDVGANVGYYTKRFAEAVGPSGRVVAFEPFPNTADQLRKNLVGIGNYTLQQFALGNVTGSVWMQVGKEDQGAANRIVDGAVDGVEINITTGDELLVKGKAETPTVIKIDTEGFELDVLHGMQTLITLPSLRALFVEVHFRLLAERGMSTAPAKIETLLKTGGFETKWVDASHIVAVRG
jgi:FkbM family methyltransferase